MNLIWSQIEPNLVTLYEILPVRCRSTFPSFRFLSLVKHHLKEKINNLLIFFINKIFFESEKNDFTSSIFMNYNFRSSRLRETSLLFKSGNS